MKASKLNIAILGSGNIGVDLLVKCMRSDLLECSMLIGRNLGSPGMRRAQSLGVQCSDKSIQAVVDEPDRFDLVFDATSAMAHMQHWPILKDLGIACVDMTPSRIGGMCVPAINLQESLKLNNVNMITCGGQASLPIARAVATAHPEVEYIEVISSIASRSAGPATRLNIDEYVTTTASAISYFTKAPRTKAILILNPATPCINMQTTVFAKLPEVDLDRVRAEVNRMVKIIQGYVPGYELILEPSFENGRLAVMVRVRGLGDHLPPYAGNLDIINCAAVAFAEERARQRGLPGAAQAPDTCHA